LVSDIASLASEAVTVAVAARSAIPTDVASPAGDVTVSSAVSSGDLDSGAAPLAPDFAAPDFAAPDFAAPDSAAHSADTVASIPDAAPLSADAKTPSQVPSDDPGSDSSSLLMTLLRRLQLKH
jgi:hypothetical protein